MQSTTVVSDLSGVTVPEGERVTIRVTFQEPSRGVFQLQARADEVAELVARGRPVRRRARRADPVQPGDRQ
ncbi:MAG: hypothetical protein R3C15_18970 [Thermoleophilia bacterium]